MVHSADPPCLACEPPALVQLIASDAALAARWQAMPRRRFAAGTTLLRIGDLAQQVWLIQRGLVRFYFLSAGGVERNKSFHAEGAWIGSGMPPRAMPSAYAIQALEEVDAIELSYDALADCAHRFPAVKPVLDEALACVFAGQTAREAELLMDDAATRYSRFVSERPGLAARLPLHHVASFLGITNVALSRIRRRLASRDSGLR